ncbi:MAG TPA: FAD-dependent oxidoreductase [Acetobacteraceae bacterium]|nr:FAD-dependent oxidoreductase [Acetobacteraceae bacterium]
MPYQPILDRSDPPAVYARTAPEAPPTPALDAPRRVQVAVIGAGFTGMSAALHLAEAGAEVAVLEAKQIGWGASGRAFGQVVPYLKIDETAILRHYGPTIGPAIIDAVAAGPDLVFGLIEKHRIACWPVRTGLIFAAHSPAGRAGLDRRVEYWQRHGAPVEMLNAARCSEMIGSEMYQAAAIDRRGGHINPFAYVRGLARAATEAGAAIFAGTPVTRIERRNGAWCVHAGGHDATAGIVIIATNAYTTQLWPGLRESVIPVRGHGFVSAPLSDNLRRSILPGGQSLTDTRRLFSAVRVLPDGRLHASGHGPVAGPEQPPDWRTVNARVARLFPQLDRVAWEQGWSGWVAMTPDHVPRLHELAPGLFAGLGYNGRGIAAATMMGRDLAVLAGGGTETAFPRVAVRPLLYAGIAPLLVRGLARLYRARDVLEEVRLAK